MKLNINPKDWEHIVKICKKTKATKKNPYMPILFVEIDKNRLIIRDVMGGRSISSTYKYTCDIEGNEDGIEDGIYEINKETITSTISKSSQVAIEINNDHMKIITDYGEAVHNIRTSGGGLCKKIEDYVNQHETETELTASEDFIEKMKWIKLIKPDYVLKYKSVIYFNKGKIMYTEGHRIFSAKISDDVVPYVENEDVGFMTNLEYTYLDLLDKKKNIVIEKHADSVAIKNDKSEIYLHQDGTNLKFSDFFEKSKCETEKEVLLSQSEMETMCDFLKDLKSIKTDFKKPIILTFEKDALKISYLDTYEKTFKIDKRNFENFKIAFSLDYFYESISKVKTIYYKDSCEFRMIKSNAPMHITYGDYEVMLLPVKIKGV